jgi:regulator of sigma D
MTETGITERLLNHAVTGLLEERKALWELFCGLAGLESCSKPSILRCLLQRFCQLLINYVSLWQCEVQDLLLCADDNHEAARFDAGGRIISGL